MLLNDVQLNRYRRVASEFGTAPFASTKDVVLQSYHLAAMTTASLALLAFGAN